MFTALSSLCVRQISTWPLSWARLCWTGTMSWSRAFSRCTPPITSSCKRLRWHFSHSSQNPPHLVCLTLPPWRRSYVVWIWNYMFLVFVWYEWLTWFTFVMEKQKCESCLKWNFMFFFLKCHNYMIKSRNEFSFTVTVAVLICTPLVFPFKEMRKQWEISCLILFPRYG